MGLKERMRKLEEKSWGGPEPPCPECNGRVILEEIAEDGTSTYPEREPCEACGSRGSGGRIGRIIVDNRDPEDRPEEEDVFTFRLDTPGRDEEGEEVTEWPKPGGRFSAGYHPFAGGNPEFASLPRARRFKGSEELEWE